MLRNGCSMMKYKSAKSGAPESYFFAINQISNEVQSTVCNVPRKK